MNTTPENPKSENPTLDNDDARRRKNRLQLIAILAIVLIPVLGSSFMYYTGIGMPESTSNQGVLIEPPIALADLSLRDADGQSWAWNTSGNFRLALAVDGVCDETCAELLHNMRQVHLLLGKRSTSLERWLVQLDDGIETTPLPSAEQSIAAAYPNLSRVRGNLRQWRERLRDNPALDTNFSGQQALLIDRRGNLVMAFDREQSGEGMLDDVKFLIKSTQ